MGKLKTFLDSKTVKKDVGEETYLTWRETISYAAGRGAQGMCTSMTTSKYVNYFMTNILSIDMKTVSAIRLFCGIFDAANDPMMGVLVDRTRTKNGQMRPYIRVAPFLVALVMVLFFIGTGSAPMWLKIVWSTFLFVALDVTYTAFDIPMGALAFSITPNGIERTKLFGVSSIVRMIAGAIPMILIAFAAFFPYFNENLDKAYLSSSIVSAIGIIIFTRFTYKNTTERAAHREDIPPVKECFRLLFKNRPLLMLFIANIFFVIVKISEQVSFYFVVDLMFDAKYNGFVDVVKAPGGVLAGILVPIIVEKIGKKADSRKFYQVCCVAAIVINALFAVTCYNGLINKPEGTAVSIPIGVLVLMFTCLATFPLEFKNLMQKEMEAETVDYVEWKTGERVEGIMLSIMSFTGKIENTFSASLGLLILGLTNYVEHSDQIPTVQSHQTNVMLFVLTTIAPIVGYLLMLIPMHFYNITGESHRQMMKDIERRNAEKAALKAEEKAQ